jgi:isopentenyl-diphosphate delta-isomerase
MPLNRDLVITVDENDVPIGTIDKMEAHRQGVLHRAFSIFLLNDNNELLLQQRAYSKYHSGGLWTNTCCSHPMPNEGTGEAAKRRLEEELGVAATLQHIFSFTYKADVGDGLTEHEFDHVYIGKHNGNCTPNPEEVQAYKYLSLDKVAEWIQQKPEQFTEWMKIVFSRFHEYILQYPLA